MSIARLRALTHVVSSHFLNHINCRNGICPIEGIDTSALFAMHPDSITVEMGFARLRTLTCTMNNSECMEFEYSKFFRV